MQLERTQNWQWTWRLHDSFIWENAKLNRMESMAPREEKVQGKLKVGGTTVVHVGRVSLRFDMTLSDFISIPHLNCLAMSNLPVMCECKYSNLALLPKIRNLPAHN